MAGTNPEEGMDNFLNILFNPSQLGEHSAAGKDAGRVDDLIRETIIDRETEGAEAAETARNQQN